MVEINSNKITLTRGDSLIVSVEPTIRGTDEVYTPIEGDTIRFAMSQKYKGKANYILAVHKEIPIDTMLLELEPSDTADLSYGEYKYDIEITHADGRVDTFISSTITLTEEVE